MPETPLPLCVRTDADDHQSRTALIKDFWREIEILEVWVQRKRMACNIPDYIIEMASAKRKQACLWIASTSFTEDRLHRDVEFPDAEADKQKMLRVERGFDKPDEAVYIARKGQQVHGFVIVSITKEHCIIELIAVDRRHRGKGIGKALLGTVAAAYEPLVLIAGTQSTNTASQRLYASMGFEREASYRTFHKAAS